MSPFLISFIDGPQSMVHRLLFRYQLKFYSHPEPVEGLFSKCSISQTKRSRSQFDFQF